MATLLLRAAKGTPLTDNEVDANFTNLNNAKVEFVDSGTLRSHISDATGTGQAVFGNDPTINTGIESGTASFNLLNTVAATINAFGAATALTLGAATGTTLINNTLHVKGDVQAFSASDARLKDNIKKIPDALQKVKALNGVTWDWSKKYAEETLSESENSVLSPTMGVIAQDVEKVLPELIRHRDNGYLAVDYPRLVAVLIEAIKELSAKVEVLEVHTLTVGK